MKEILHGRSGRLGCRCAFTLVELLVVIAIVAVLATVALVATGQMRVKAKQVACLSNQRQIGIGLMSYASENNGELPVTTHTTGSFRKDRSWIFLLAPYFGNESGKVDNIRICPADPPKRQKRIRQMNATSYVLNDLVFDSPKYNRLVNIAQPSKTILLCILNEDRAPSITRDHTHGAEWTSWAAALNDIEPDRHRTGGRATDRLKGSANYLYADGSARNIGAKAFKSLFDQGRNPAVPE